MKFLGIGKACYNQLMFKPTWLKFMSTYLSKHVRCVCVKNAKKVEKLGLFVQYDVTKEENLYCYDYGFLIPRI